MLLQIPLQHQMTSLSFDKVFAVLDNSYSGDDNAVGDRVSGPLAADSLLGKMRLNREAVIFCHSSDK